MTGLIGAYYLIKPYRGGDRVQEDTVLRFVSDFTSSFVRAGDLYYKHLLTIPKKLSEEEADFIYRYHRGAPYNDENVKYLTSGYSYITCITPRPGEALEAVSVFHHLAKGGELSVRYFLSNFSEEYLRYDVVYVPDLVQQATEDLKMLGLIKG